MKRIFFILIIVSLTYQVRAQAIYSHQPSSVPESSRFEIVQSELGVEYIFKIDKYSGEVFRLVEGDPTYYTWENMEVSNHPRDVATEDKINYQIIISGISTWYILLLNVNTGATWQIARNLESGSIFWRALE
jgi:hypothetical protein